MSQTIVLRCTACGFDRFKVYQEGAHLLCECADPTCKSRSVVSAPGSRIDIAPAKGSTGALAPF